MATGWIDYQGRHYNADSLGAIRFGWYEEGDSIYWLDPSLDGAAAIGEFSVSGESYFADSSGVVVTNQWVSLQDGTASYADSTGALNGSLVDGVLYVDGTPASGWTNLGAAKFYALPDGTPVSGMYEIDGSTFFFDTTSFVMRTGWVNHGDAWYYFDASSGVKCTDWIKVGGKWYYLDPETGAMKTGWLLAPDDNWYYLDGSGAMVTGWRKVGGTWHYLGSSGAMATGWLKLGSTWYYLDPESGAMKTGWLQLGGSWYWLDGSGAMAVGVRKIGGKTYFFDSSGRWVEEPMIGKAQSLSSSTKWLILVDTTNNYVGIFYGSRNNWELKYRWDCTTGAPSTPTVLGQYTVKSKGYSFGHGYTCYYYTQFYGDYLFHSIKYYQGTFKVMDGRLGQNLSLGCVRLSLSNAKWVYSNIPAGTKVYIYR